MCNRWWMLRLRLAYTHGLSGWQLLFWLYYNQDRKAHKVCDDCGYFAFALLTPMVCRVGNYFFCCTTIKTEKHTRCVTIADTSASPCIHSWPAVLASTFLLYYNQGRKKHTRCVTIADTAASPCIHSWSVVLVITFFVILQSR